ncbi:MAG TPA: oligosaccharide flippase family protein [Alloacidobacterium sp.]|nr:oligosaccharide flippase family protein [Alloacidobacterium sp.]
MTTAIGSRLVQEYEKIRASAMARNAGWMLAGQGIGVVSQAIYFVVLARLLGAVEFGIFAGAYAFASLAAPYSSLGTGTLLLRYVSLDRSQSKAYWGNVVLVTSIVGGLLIFGIHFLGLHLLNPSSAHLVALAAFANCLCAQLTLESGRVFQAFEKLRITAILNLLTNIVRALTALTMLLTLHHATAFQWMIATTAVSFAVAVVAVVAATSLCGPPRPRPRLFWKHGAEGLGYSFAVSTFSVYNDIDKTMLSHYGMNLANGIYTMAYRAIDIATLPVLSIRDAALPRFFQRGAAGLGSASELSYRLLKRALPLALAATAALFLAAPLIPRILGHGFLNSVEALRWLCLIPVFRSVHQMTGSSLTGAGLQNYRTGAQVVAAGLNFLLNLWLIPNYGWHGAAWSSLVTDGALGVMNWSLLQVLTRRRS